MHVIAVFNQKGGVGKTTIAVNLAVTLASLDYKTVLIDMDFQGDGTRQLWDGEPPKLTVYDLLARQCCAEEAAVDTGFPNLAFIASSRRLSLIEAGADGAGGRQTELRQNGFSRAPVDFVIIDCPPALGRLAANALMAANMLVIPVTPTAFAVEGMNRTLDIYRAAKGGLNPELQEYRICVSMMDEKPLSRAFTNELIAAHRDHMLPTTVPLDGDVNKAATYHTPAVFYNPNSDFAHAITALAADIVAVLGLALPARALADMRGRIEGKHGELAQRFKSIAERNAEHVSVDALPEVRRAPPNQNVRVHSVAASRVTPFMVGSILGAAIGFFSAHM